MKEIREGSLYRTISLYGKDFHIYYGYLSESERSIWDPAPIFPDFKKTPLYTDGGEPYTRADQDICEHYSPKPRVSGEDWCNDCSHFELGEEIIGICRCDKRKCILRKNE